MIGEGIRGARLESTISKLMFASSCKKRFCQIIGMSATLPNLSEIAEYLHAELFTSDFRPVPLVQYLKLNKFIYRVEETAENISTVYDRQVKSKDDKTDPDGLFPLVLELIPEHSILIFCPTRRNCQAVTALLSNQMLNFEFCPDLLEKRKNVTRELNEEMKDIGGIDRAYAQGLLSGIAYHHGK